jgi:mono/diheme cytochrome c family protein
MTEDKTETPSPDVPREPKFEPYELNRPIPMAVIAFALALTAWGAFTLWADDGGTDDPASAQVAAPERPADVAEAEAAALDGAHLFALNCQTCHQINGLGVAGAVPPLAGSRYVLGDPEVTASLVLHGLEGPIAVKGRFYDGTMPAFGEVLSDAQIAAILTHIRSAWGNDAPPVTPESVAAARERFAADRGPFAGGAELESAFGVPAGLKTGRADEAPADENDEERAG